MSKKSVENIKNNNSFNIDIEELKGTRITINGEESKYLVIYEDDVAFVEDLISYADYLNSLEKRYSALNTEIDEDASEEDSMEKINKTLEEVNEIIKESKERFNVIFKDDTAFDRIFGNIKTLNLVVVVIGRILDFVYNERKDKINSTKKYTERYKK